MNQDKDGYWFRAKRYGWGWYPCSWQGWVVVICYVGYVVYRAQSVEKMFDTQTSIWWRMGFELIPATMVLIGISYMKGEKPRWRWGR